MEIEKWIEKGLDSFRTNHWFDGIQYIQGGLQRSFQSDQSKMAETIFKTTSEFLLNASKYELYCQIIMASISHLRKKTQVKNWIKVYPVIFSTLDNQSMKSCQNKFINKIIATKSFQEENFIGELHDLISKEDFQLEIKSNLYLCTAGLLCWQKEYVKCFEMLSEWNKLVPSSPKILTYLTLAELNAFEVDGVSEYLNEANSLINKSSSDSDNEYIELCSQLVKSVELKNYEFLLSILEDNNEIVDVKNDALMTALCDGLVDFIKPKSNKNMFSLFG